MHRLRRIGWGWGAGRKERYVGEDRREGWGARYRFGKPGPEHVDLMELEDSLHRK